MKVLGAIVGVLIAIFVVPFVSFWLCYFGGWICSLTIGDVLADGLNTVFKTTHFTKDIIPLTAGTLGWVGGYFKSKNINTSNWKTKFDY